MFGQRKSHWWTALGLLVIVSLVVLGCAGGKSFISMDQNDLIEPSPTETIDEATATRIRPETLLEATPRWMRQADSLMAAGDTALAEERTMDAILGLQSLVLELPERAQPALVDTLLVWRDVYENSFGPFAMDMVATDEGVMALLTAQESDMGEESPLQALALDSAAVVLDPTISEVDRLPDIPDTLNAKIDRMIRYFTQNERGRLSMTRWLERAGEMIPRMQPTLALHGVPDDLVYLSMIESGFREDARSWARAVGPWQFIGSTAKTFDLEADWWYDERRSPEQATHAAARFLRQLYDHLGDWYLALAAYNCGEGRVRREIRRSKSHDFWDLKRLPSQTRNYIPTYLAARKIAKDPEAYGFPPLVFTKPQPRDAVFVHEPVELSALATALDVELDVLRRLNPSLIRWCTPPNRDSTQVFLPAGMATNFSTAYASIPDEKKTSWTRHKVRSGETLSTIATKYGTTTRAIMDVPANGISNPHRISINQYLLIPVSTASISSTGLYAMSDPELPDGYQRRTHTVRRGDTLSQIAELYHVGLSKLLRWNGLSKRSIIRPGQKLVVYPPAPRTTQTASATPKVKAVTTTATTETVLAPQPLTSDLSRWMLIRDARTPRPAEEPISQHAPEMK